MSPLLTKRMAIAFAAAGLVSASEAISPPPPPPLIAVNLAVQQANLATQQANLATQQAIANAKKVECMRVAASDAASAPQVEANCKVKASDSQVLVRVFQGLAILTQVGVLGVIGVIEIKEMVERKAGDRQSSRKKGGWALGR